MGSDRQVIADQILKAIDYGNLPQDEIERRLEQIIETELNVPFNAEINKDKVDLCNSLLRRLYSQGGIEDKVDIEESKEKVRKRVNTYRRRRNILWTAVRSIAAALILVVGLTMLNIIPPIRWFTGTSTDDEQQYIVQGHVINTQTIANAISEHNESGAFSAQSNQEVNTYLGFDICFPSSIKDKYYPKKYYVFIMPEFIRVNCNYDSINNEYDNPSINLSVTLFTNTADAFLHYEQDVEGTYISIKGTNIYRYENAGQIGYIWIKENALYRLVHDVSVHLENEILQDVLIWRGI